MDHLVVFCYCSISWYVEVLPASTYSVIVATMCAYQQSTKLEMHTILNMGTLQTWNQMVFPSVSQCWPFRGSSNEKNNMPGHLQVQEELRKWRNLYSFFGVSSDLEHKQWDPGIGHTELQSFLKQDQRTLAARFRGCPEYQYAAFRPCRPHQAIAWGQAMFLGGGNVMPSDQRGGYTGLGRHGPWTGCTGLAV